MSENQTGNTQGGAVLHVDPTVGDGVVNVPGGDMFLVADYVRERSDLVLVGHDGQTVVIDNYFAMANPPALQPQQVPEFPVIWCKSWLVRWRPVNTRKQAKTRANRLNK